MKTLLICRSDLEFGADRAAYRLHRGLQQIGVESQMLVQNKLTDDPSVISPGGNLGKKLANFRETFDALPLKFYRQRPPTMFWPEWVPDKLQSHVSHLNPDVINVHWICRGYMQWETLLKLNKPILWTFHDMWGFTGGCNYSEECDRYQQSCGKCPQLNSDKDWDLSRLVWNRKLKTLKNLNLVVVTPSQWMAECTRSSSLFKNVRVEVIPNGLDPQTYQPIDQKVARTLLKLPLDKQLILFGAVSATSDHRKGFHLLQTTLQRLSKAGWRDQFELLVFGASKPSNEIELGFKSHYLGKLNDDLSLALVYSAADVFVAPSIQDNLPNTVLEAIACGTPCVAFKIGGMPDLIDHQQNGYLASAYEIDDLIQGITWVLEDRERHQKLGQSARKKFEQGFTWELQAHRYLSVLGEMVAG
ncbi:MAG: glycosyltransferase family 4 protein [Planktothrix sp.]